MTAARNRVALCQSIKLLKVAFNFYSSQLLCRPTVQSPLHTRHPPPHRQQHVVRENNANKTKAATFTRRQAKTSTNKLQQHNKKNNNKEMEMEAEKIWNCARLIFEWIFRNTLAHCSHNFHTLSTPCSSNFCFFFGFCVLFFLVARKKCSLVVFFAVCAMLWTFSLTSKFIYKQLLLLLLLSGIVRATFGLFI